MTKSLFINTPIKNDMKDTPKLILSISMNLFLKFKSFATEI